jgi:hypothetical protein
VESVAAAAATIAGPDGLAVDIGAARFVTPSVVVRPAAAAAAAACAVNLYVPHEAAARLPELLRAVPQVRAGRRSDWARSGILAISCGKNLRGVV